MAEKAKREGFHWLLIAAIGGAYMLTELGTAQEFNANEWAGLGAIVASMRGGVEVILRNPGARQVIRDILDRYEA